ncbi:MAG: Na+/galactose cotransporter, partial [Acidobacteriota bacterium]
THLGGQKALSIVAFSPDAKPMAENMSRAMWSFTVSVLVCVLVSLVTKPRPVEELNGLAYSATNLPKAETVAFYRNHWFWAAIVIVCFIAGNIIFW